MGSSCSPRVGIHALGCKLNQSELEDYARRLKAYGVVLVGGHEKADVYILNTCTVTAESDRKVRQWLRRARRQNAAALIVAAGCSVTREREVLSRIADVVLDNNEKSNLPEVVIERLAHLSCRQVPGTERPWRPRTRAMVKIQEGCSMACTYCVIPLVRGGERSRPVGDVVDDVIDRIREGHLEIVLTGTRPGAYAAADIRLSGLVEQILCIDGLQRVRLSSLQPHELSPDVLRLWSDSRVCPHVHMSLQSGSGSVLRRMRRPYSPAAFLAAMEKLRDAAPYMAITTDVIVGFPGETDSEFVETLEFCEKARFSRIHVFPYSARPGTAAAEMGDQVPRCVLRERVAAMSRLAAWSRTEYERTCVGTVRSVLWEEEVRSGNGMFAGTTDDYVRVFTDCDVRLNTVERVVVDCVDKGRVMVRRLREDSCRSETELESARH